ncbi:MAG: lysoplasmalogenase [Desulfomonilaceae bacterium]|jgi:uncharacterized membrane protein YhhN
MNFIPGAAMVRVVLPIVSCSLLVGLLWAEKTDSYKLILLFKAPLSSLFVLTAALLPHHFKRYCRLVITGLILGLVGDICLALPGNMPFRFGLVAFLGGHVFYILAFAQQTQRTDWFHSVNFLILAFSGYVLWWLYPHLGSMLIPVVCYILIISVMVSGAWAVFRNPYTNRIFAWSILSGALLFYVSDIFVARNRFIDPDFLNRLVGLPLYYIGQFILAFSVGLAGRRIMENPGSKEK